MGVPLNIRDIGEEHKAALLLEAKHRGTALAEVAREGLAYEAKRLEEDGPTPARYRQVLA